MHFDQEGYLEDGKALYETGKKMTALADKVAEDVYKRQVQKCPAARDHDLLGSKFRRDIYNVLKVRERAGTRLIPARRDIPRLGVCLLYTSRCV